MATRIGAQTEQKATLDDDDFVMVEKPNAEISEEHKSDGPSNSVAIEIQVATKEELDLTTKYSSTPKKEMIDIAIESDAPTLIKKGTCCSSFWKWICCKK